MRKEEEDWLFALTTLEISAEWGDEGPLGLRTELRYRERTLGTTADARQRLRIRYVDAGAAATPANKVARLDDYRDL